MRAAIVDGSPATLYPEAVVIEMSKQGLVVAACSGALIAPQVVLTAGHCVAPYSGWDVRAPVIGQSAHATAAETFDWKDDGTDVVKQSQHDIGLIFLDTAIDLPEYPAIADAALRDGTNVVNIGRIHDGQVSGSLFLSMPLGVVGAARIGFPLDYRTSRVIELGDSGGPVEIPGAAPHTIAAVNSGVAGDMELLARVDLVHSWIQARVAAHGGGGSTEAPVLATPPPADCAGL